MKNKKWRIFIGITCLLLVAIALPTYGADNIPRISAEQLKNTLENSNLVLLDVRTEKDWNKSDRKIVGATRVDPEDIKSWAGDYSKDQKIVAYCA